MNGLIQGVLLWSIDSAPSSPDRAQQLPLERAQEQTILGFAGHTFSAASTQLCPEA